MPEAVNVRLVFPILTRLFSIGYSIVNFIIVDGPQVGLHQVLASVLVLGQYQHILVVSESVKYTSTNSVVGILNFYEILSKSFLFG